MRKYGELCPADARPDLRFDLDGLDYPARMNVAETLLEGALRAGWGARTAYFHRGETITYAALRAAVHRHAAALRGFGVAPGDRVVLRIADTPSLVHVLLAAHAIGAVPIPTYVQLRADDLAYRLADSGARFAIASADLADEMAAAVRAVPGVALAVADGDGDGTRRSLRELLPEGEVAPEYFDSHAEDLTLILYTSGSTGRPKGTCHCHRDLIAAADSYWKHCIGPTGDDVIGGPPSVPFALGYGLYVVFPARFGSAAVLEPDKSVEASLAAIERYDVTIFTAVVSYYRLLAAALDRKRIASLRRSMTGGEPLLPETESLWREASGMVLEQFIGTTETFHCFLTTAEPARPARPGCLGRAAPGYEVAVLDADTLAPVADGEQGLMAVRGCTGTVYWRNDERQRELVRNGWNVFPDVVTRDAEGWFRYVARHDDMIVSAGYNISPIQVETALLRHQAVLECACVPAPDPAGVRGSIVKAYVVAAPGHETGEALAAALQAHVRAVAPPYMYPRAVDFVSALPKTVNGKVLRSELRARAASFDTPPSGATQDEGGGERPKPSPHPE